MKIPRIISGLSACALGAALAGSGVAADAASAPVTRTATTQLSGAEDPATSALRLRTPRRVRGYVGNGTVAFDPGIRLIARGGPVEVWSTRPSYKKPIVTEVRTASGTTVLPTGLQKRFGRLPGFLKLEYRTTDGTLVATDWQGVCLNSWNSQRISPDAPLRSPYPTSCSRNRFTRGGVMGIQDGWSSQVEWWAAQPLRAGRYRVSVSVSRTYRKALGLAKENVSSTFTLVAKKGDGYQRPAPARAIQQPRASLPQPAAQEPGRDRAGAAGPTPDLRSIPAWGIRISRDGNHLQFSATVWNAGDSPLVVDGFRRDGEDVMDAYQYFVDADGNQTGYQKVGTMEWDRKDTHQHWHFRDFARYRLLDADKQGVVRSRKEAFCLANTDAIDYTIPGADWQPDGTDLHTSCGDRDSLSIREVLSAGSGDTYAQFRAGQSFNLEALPNGTYYIAVEANPKGRLVEQSEANNVAHRRIVLGGSPGARTVRVGKVGMVD